MLQKKSSKFIKSSANARSSEELLKLYSKEYHEGHLSWAKNETPIYYHYRDNYMRLIHPQKGLKILELGCSAGKTTVEMAKHGCHVIAVDFDQNAIDLATQFAKDSGVADRVQFICSSADSIDLMNNDFDRVTMLDFVEHVPDEVIERILNNLRNKNFNGDICIYTPDRHHFTEILSEWGVLQGDETHINLKSRQEWVDLLTKCDLEIKTLTRETSHWPILKSLEKFINNWPLVGGLFTRSIAIRGQV